MTCLRVGKGQGLGHAQTIVPEMAGTLSEQEVQAYLDQHKIQPTVEEAINSCVKNQAADPSTHMAEFLLAKAKPAITEEDYTQDGPVAQKIAAVIPYYKFKGIPRFYDINGFLTNPPIFQLVIDVFAKRYKDANLTSIGGFDARGFVIGPPLALALKIPFFMLRKVGKMPNGVSSDGYEVEYGKRTGMCIPRGHPLDKADPSGKSTVVKAGDRVLLVDDLVATGGTLSSGIELVQKMGGIVHECACVVEVRNDTPLARPVAHARDPWRTLATRGRTLTRDLALTTNAAHSADSSLADRSCAAPSHSLAP